MRIGRRMRSAITTYNNLAALSISSLSFPNTITFKEVISDQWHVWQLLYADDSSSGNGEITYGIKRMAVDLFNMYERAEEERFNISSDMTCLCNHLIRQYKTVVECICQYNEDAGAYAVGVTCHLISKAIKLEEDIVLCTESFAVYVDSSEVALCGFREQFGQPPAYNGLSQSLIPAEVSSQSCTVTDDCVIPENCDSDIDSIQTDIDSDAHDELL